MFTKSQIERIQKAVAGAIADAIEDDHNLYDKVCKLIDDENLLEDVIKKEVDKQLKDPHGLRTRIEEIVEEETDEEHIRDRVRENIQRRVFS